MEKFWPLSDIFLSHYLQLYMTRLLVIVQWISEALFIILRPFSLSFRISKMYWSIYWFSDFFFCCIWSPLRKSNEFWISNTVSFTSRISIWFFQFYSQLRFLPFVHLLWPYCPEILECIYNSCFEVFVNSEV